MHTAVSPHRWVRSAALLHVARPAQPPADLPRSVAVILHEMIAGAADAADGAPRRRAEAPGVRCPRARMELGPAQRGRAVPQRAENVGAQAPIAVEPPLSVHGPRDLCLCLPDRRDRP
jgi:hypothetical protein